MAFTTRCLFLFFFLSGCTSLIYQPDKYIYAHPDHFKTSFETFSFDSTDGTRLSGWKLFSKTRSLKKDRNLIVMFHGNAQNLTSHFVNLVWLADYDYDVVIFDYRGYGLSAGEPEPEGVAGDGLAFLNYTYDYYKKENYRKYIVYTQSLGGAVALRSLEDFKHRSDVSLLVLDSTFLSPRLVARDKTNRVLQYLISNDFTADPELTHITMPVLSIHSTADFVINYKLGLDLFNKIRHSPKKELWTFHAKGHGDVFFVENFKFRNQFLDFVKKLP